MPLEILYLTEDEVRQCLSMPDAVALSEKGVRATAEGRISGDKFYMQIGEAGFVKPFAAYLDGESHALLKSFSFFAGNRADGLPPTSSFTTLIDAGNGLPACIMESNWLTAFKTGASTAATVRQLARPGSSVAAIFGAGGLGRTHLLGLHEVLSLEEVRVVDVLPEAAERFAAEMGEATGLPIAVAATPEDAVRGADVVVTVTTGSAVNVERAWLKPGALVARMGSYQEIASDVVLEADKLVVDRWKFVSTRVPELVELVAAGRLGPEAVHAEWPDIAAGRAVGRESEDEVIVYVALGILGEYAAILPHVYRQAQAQGLGRALSSQLAG